MQRSVYNGWKSIHGTKYETSTGPDGLCLHLYGGAPGTVGVSVRHNDLFLLRHGHVNEKLAAAHVAHAAVLPHISYVLYGDSIYIWRPHVRSRQHAQAGHPNKQQLDNEDGAMNACRESAEWHYGEGQQHFPFTVAKETNKIMAGVPLRKIYFTRVLLMNLYVCLYHNKTSKYFDCDPPTPEEYMAWQ